MNLTNTNLFQTKLCYLNNGLPENKLFYDRAIAAVTGLMEQLTPLFSYLSECTRIQKETVLQPIETDVHSGDFPLEDTNLILLGNYFNGVNATIELVMDSRGEMFQAYRCKNCILSLNHLKLRKLADNALPYAELTTAAITTILGRKIDEGNRKRDALIASMIESLKMLTQSTQTGASA